MSFVRFWALLPVIFFTAFGVFAAGNFLTELADSIGANGDKLVAKSFGLDDLKAENRDSELILSVIANIQKDDKDLAKTLLYDFKNDLRDGQLSASSTELITDFADDIVESTKNFPDTDAKILDDLIAKIENAALAIKLEKVEAQNWSIKKPITLKISNIGENNITICEAQNLPQGAFIGAEDGACIILGIRMKAQDSEEAIITASNGQGKDELSINIRVKRSKQTGFNIGDNISKNLNDSKFTQAATGGQSHGSITYHSSNIANAIVDDNGVITILGSGSAIITATRAGDSRYEDASDSYTLNIIDPEQIVFARKAEPVVPPQPEPKIRDILLPRNKPKLEPVITPQPKPQTKPKSEIILAAAPPIITPPQPEPKPKPEVKVEVEPVAPKPKPEVKIEVKPEVKAEVKPVAPTPKPEVKTEVKVEVEPVAPKPKPEVKVEVEPEVKVEVEPVAPKPKPEVKAEVKTEVKVKVEPVAPKPKPEVKVEVKPEVKVEVEPVAPTPKPEVKVEVKPEVKVKVEPVAPKPKPEVKIEVKPEVKAEVKPVAPKPKTFTPPKPFKNTFVKLDQNGAVLPRQDLKWDDFGSAASGTKWSCVKDKATGLVWEVKTTSGIHDKKLKYRWGGASSIGSRHFGKKGDYYRDWDTLLHATNRENLCGFSDWRVPDIAELAAIVDLTRSKPAIDHNYFPNTVTDYYWSASPYADNEFNAWLLNFKYGADYNLGRLDKNRVRLVR